MDKSDDDEDNHEKQSSCQASLSSKNAFLLERDDLGPSRTGRYFNFHHRRCSSEVTNPAEVVATPSRNDADKEDNAIRGVAVSIKQLCTSNVVASSLFPRPEALRLRLSYRGRWALAVNSSRIVIFDTQQIFENRAKAFAVRQRPIAFDIHDNGLLLVMLTRKHSVSVYQLSSDQNHPVQFVRAINLDFPCKDVMLSPDGLFFTAIQETGNGLEFVSLTSGRTTINHRLVACKGFHSGTFSVDSRTLLGTSTVPDGNVTSIFSVHLPDEPFSVYDDADGGKSDRAWMRNLLFPQLIQNVSHATILHDSEIRFVDEVIALHHTFNELFVMDVKSGTPTGTIFSLKHRRPNCSVQLGSISPVVSRNGDRLAVAVLGDNQHEIWIYEVPEHNQTLAYTTRSVSTNTDAVRKLVEPRWRIQLWTDQSSRIEYITGLKWIDCIDSQDVLEKAARLAVVGNCTDVNPLIQDVSLKPFSPEANIIIIDLDSDTVSQSIGVVHLDNIETADVLPTQQLELEQEVELVRRRTTAQRKLQGDNSSTRQPKTIGRGANRSSRQQSPTSLRGSDVSPTWEEPYSHTQPRPTASLHRAATVAAESSPRRTRLRALPTYEIEYRRADGRMSHHVPHESDGDDWVPPPPPYTPEPDALSGIARILATPTIDRTADLSTSCARFVPALQSHNYRRRTYVDPSSSYNATARPSRQVAARASSVNAQILPISAPILPAAPTLTNTNTALLAISRPTPEPVSVEPHQSTTRVYQGSFSAEDLRLPPDVEHSQHQDIASIMSPEYQHIRPWRSRTEEVQQPYFWRRSQTYSAQPVSYPRRPTSFQGVEEDSSTRKKMSSVLKSSCNLM